MALAICPTLVAIWQFRSILWNNNFHVVRQGEVYRSAQPTGRQFDTLANRLGLHSVVSLYSGKYMAEEKQVAQRHGICLYSLNFALEGLPQPGELQELVRILDTCPSPVLLHGRWGIGPTALAAAVADLLHGEGPDRALREFGVKYGIIGKASQAELIRQYTRWLTSHGESHSAEQFRCWATTEYKG
jgi:hypothetical protein